MSTRSGAFRRQYIDWARGIAVLLMIEAHTSDAWTRLADKHSFRFGVAGILGGFAAPMFLWLAGVGVALSATSTAARRQSTWAAVDAVCRRGLEIFILAFLFRLQAFIVSPGSYPVTLFRVDILNVMGPAIVASGVFWAAGATPVRRALVFGVAATCVAMVTPIVRTLSGVTRLPIWVQWYVRPSGDYSTFTAFPWAGFVFAGVAYGALLAGTVERRAERRFQIIGALVGGLLVWLGFYTSARPSIYAQSSFWTSSPTWFAIRLGIMMIALTVLYGAADLCSRHGVAAAWLARLGRSSLFVYWIHVELVYGYASWWWRGRLPLWGTALAYVAFVALMYGAIALRDSVVGRWRTRPPRASGTLDDGGQARYWSFDLSKNS
jgi:uncharacterized membrane protein